LQESSHRHLLPNAHSSHMKLLPQDCAAGDLARRSVGIAQKEKAAQYGGHSFIDRSGLTLLTALLIVPALGGVPLLPLGIVLLVLLSGVLARLPALLLAVFILLILLTRVLVLLAALLAALVLICHCGASSQCAGGDTEIEQGAVESRSV